MTDRRREGRMRKKLGWIIPLSVLLILAAAFFVKYAPIDLARGKIGIFIKVFVYETFVMP